MTDRSRSQATDDQPAIGYVVRLFWMAFGNVALFFTWMHIASSERIGAADAVYGALVLALLLARWIDITRLNGMTSRAEPATRAHLRRYAIALIAIALAGWFVARLLSGLDS